MIKLASLCYLTIIIGGGVIVEGGAAGGWAWGLGLGLPPGAAGAGLRLGLSIGCSSMVKHWQLKLYDSSPGSNYCMVTASSIYIYIYCMTHGACKKR